jgi:hypothetical protein
MGNLNGIYIVYVQENALDSLKCLRVIPRKYSSKMAFFVFTFANGIQSPDYSGCYYQLRVPNYNEVQLILNQSYLFSTS